MPTATENNELITALTSRVGKLEVEVGRLRQQLEGPAGLEKMFELVIENSRHLRDLSGKMDAFGGELSRQGVAIADIKGKQWSMWRLISVVAGAMIGTGTAGGGIGALVVRALSQ